MTAAADTPATPTLSRILVRLTETGMWKYTTQQMADAVKDVQLGTAVSTAAKRHGVPRITLLYKVRGKTPLERRIGRFSVLSENEEKILVHWMKTTSMAGFPVTATQVCDSVKELVQKLGRDNTFKNGRPGKKWMAGFLKRNPTVSIRTAENLTINRASLTKERLSSWYDEVETFLKNKGLMGILDDPQRVFNGDETAFFLNPKGNKVLAQKGSKNVYLTVNSDEKECLTVLVTANAAGMLAPPLVVFKYERVPSYVANSVPAGWGIGRSESGWMTGATFYEFMGNVFYPWLLKNDITLPIIFFLDGHVSHLTLHLSDLCREKGIILIALPPNATHVIQPMDVAVFRALKEKWKTTVHEWRLQNADNPILKKHQFCSLLQKVLEEKITPSIVGNGFRKCGLLPWNPQAISFEHNIENPPGQEHPHHSPPNTKEHSSDKTKYHTCVSVIREIIGEERYKTFCDSLNNPSGVADSSLYEFWKEVQSHKQIHGKHNNNSNEECLQDEYPNNDELAIESADNFNDESRENTRKVCATPIGDIESSTPKNITNDSDPLAVLHNEYPEGGTNTGTRHVSSEAPENGHSHAHSTLPSPFKNCLLWPDGKNCHQQSKRRRQEKVPSVVTSDTFRDYHERKERKKMEAEAAKIEKSRERMKKKEERAQQLQKKRDDTRKRKEEMKRQKEEMKKKKEELKVKKSRPIKKSRRSVDYSSPSESSSESEEWAPSIDTEDDIQLFDIFSDMDEDRDVAQQNTVTEGREEELTNEVEPVVESLKEDELISLPAGTSEQSVPSNSVVDQAKRSPQRCVDEKTTTVEEIGRCAVTRKSGDEEEVGRINEGDMVVAVLPNKKRETECVCLVVKIDSGDNAEVTPLLPCNRLRTVFKPSSNGNHLLSVSNVQYKLPKPRYYRGNPDKFVFPVSVSVPL